MFFVLGSDVKLQPFSVVVVVVAVVIVVSVVLGSIVGDVVTLTERALPSKSSALQYPRMGFCRLVSILQTGM